MKNVLESMMKVELKLLIMWKLRFGTENCDEGVECDGGWTTKFKVKIAGLLIHFSVGQSWT